MEARTRCSAEEKRDWRKVAALVAAAWPRAWPPRRWQRELARGVPLDPTEVELESWDCTPLLLDACTGDVGEVSRACRATTRAARTAGSPTGVPGTTSPGCRSCPHSRRNADAAHGRRSGLWCRRDGQVVFDARHAVGAVGDLQDLLERLFVGDRDPRLQTISLVEETGPLSAPDDSPDNLIVDAFSRRPELLALGFESESDQKLRNAERDQNLPTISALGAIGDTPIRDSRLSSWYGAVGVNVQVPIFNGFLFTARTREADLRAQAADQRVLDLRNRISRDVRSAWLDARTAYQRLSVSAQLLDQANRALDLSQTRYQLGLGSIVELSQAQLQQTQAQIGNAQAGYQYRLAQSVLRYQTGSL